MSQDDPYADPRLYDLEYADHDEDVAHYVTLARAARGPVLELGCGTGRLILPFARAGVSVCGIDLSQPMLDHLERKLRSETLATRLRVQIQRADFRTLELTERFPLVLWPFNALHHCRGPEEVRQTLETVRRHLAPKGRLALDCYLPDIELYDRDPEARFEPRSFIDPHSGQHLESWEQGWWDADSQVHHVLYVYRRPDGQEHRAHLALRMYALDEIRGILTQHGWQIESEAQDFVGTSVSPEALKWVVTARPS